MQALAVIAALALAGMGFTVAGFPGVLTGLVAGAGVGRGFAIFLTQPETDSETTDGAAMFAERLVGLIAAMGCLMGAWFGGWRTGWFWGLAGYAAGAVVAWGIGAVVTRGRG